MIEHSMVLKEFLDCVYAHYTSGAKPGMFVPLQELKLSNSSRILRFTWHLTLAEIMTSIVRLMTRMLQCLFGIIVVLGLGLKNVLH